MVRWEHGATMTLPRPTGHFVVGRTSFVWTNDALTDALAPQADIKRTVFAWMWYPSSTSRAPAAPYLPPAWREAQTDSLGTLMREFLNRDTARIRDRTDGPLRRRPDEFCLDERRVDRRSRAAGRHQTHGLCLDVVSLLHFTCAGGAVPAASVARGSDGLAGNADARVPESRHGPDPRSDRRATSSSAGRVLSGRTTR